MGFPRQEYCTGLPLPSPGDLPNPGMYPTSPALAGGFFTTKPPGQPSPSNTWANKFFFCLKTIWERFPNAYTWQILTQLMPFVNKLQQTKTFLSIDGFLLIYKFFLLYNLWVFLPIEPTPASHHCLSAPFLFSMYPKYPNSLSFQSCHPLSSPGEFSVSRIDKDVGHNPPISFFSFLEGNHSGLSDLRNWLSRTLRKHSWKQITQGAFRVADSTFYCCLWAVGSSSWLVPRCHPHMTLKSWPEMLSEGNSSWCLY